jgi:hypothetical protein
MATKREGFRLEERKSRLDLRITASMRARLEKYCKANKSRLTDAIEEAVEAFLKKNKVR